MKKDLLSFRHLKPYVAFLIEHKMDEFTRVDIERSKNVNIHLLQLFKGLSEAQLHQFSKEQLLIFFRQILNGTVIDDILKGNQDWKEDKVPGIPRGQVLASDIALIYNIKKHSFMAFLKDYTSDVDEMLAIIRELEDLYTFQESRAIETFSEISKEEISLREEKLREAQAIAHLGSWEYDVANDTVVWSDEMYRIFGYEPGSLKIDFETYTRLLHPEDRKLAIDLVSECLQNATPYSFRHRIVRKDGTIRWKLGKGKAITDNNGKVIKLAGVGLDITESKLAEDKILKNEALLLETQEIASLGSFEWNILEDTSIVTPEVSRIFGYKDGETFSYKSFTDHLHPDDKLLVHNELHKSFSSGAPYICEYRIQRKHDNALRHIWTKGKISYNNKGEPEKLVGSLMDITERKQIEDALKTRQLLLEASNKELEAFCYTISHDLRSPLRAIDGFGRKLANNYEHLFDEEGKRLLNVVRNNAQKMGLMIDSLLDFSRLNRKELKKHKVDMSALVHKVVAECKEQYPEHATEFVVNDLGHIDADHDLLHQVWQNLIANAIKFSSKATAPKIEIYAQVKKDHTVFSVKDNGAGFEMAYKDKLFGVFQRLHSTSEFPGNGVGLATVQRIVLRHGGTVSAEGEPDNGAIFSFSLPHSKKPERLSKADDKALISELS